MYRDFGVNPVNLTKPGERLDIGTTSTSGGVDPAMATLGEVDGSKHAGR